MFCYKIGFRFKRKMDLSLFIKWHRFLPLAATFSESLKHHPAPIPFSASRTFLSPIKQSKTHLPHFTLIISNHKGATQLVKNVGVDRWLCKFHTTLLKAKANQVIHKRSNQESIGCCEWWVTRTVPKCSRRGRRLCRLLTWKFWNFHNLSCCLHNDY